MIKYLILYNILLATFIHGSTIPPPKIPVKPISNEVSELIGNKTSEAISEGGAIIPSNPVTLANDNESLPKNLDKDVSSNKGKSVVPRKGVVYNAVEDVISHDKIDESSANKKNNSVSNTSVELLQPKKVMQNDSSTVPAASDAQQLNVTRAHKPLILSHEALAKMDEINHLDLDENGPDIKVHSIKAGSHPGMIMPIVITILVVPMFAVLGYMALKRGQEAWKNRHYKRMDFLLDGMYND